MDETIIDNKYGFREFLPEIDTEEFETYAFFQLGIMLRYPDYKLNY